jgi:CubicO group peptidase (beta-lactamase class C family)
VDSVMKAFGVPGISLTIVKDGKVVLAKGYGVRRLGDPTPVDAGTLFGIASNTKVFTALSLGLLVERGKVEWDAPVINYLPWFQMYDSWVTREITVRDLLVHRSGLGLGAGDLLWWPASDYTRAQIARQLRFIKPATSFRYSYAYDNVLYTVAGELVEAVSGQTWEEFVRTNILVPAGMTTSFSHYPAPDQRGNLASPHAVVEGRAGVARHERRHEWRHHDQRPVSAKWLMADWARATAALYTRAGRALWMPVTILNNPPPQPAPLTPTSGLRTG